MLVKETFLHPTNTAGHYLAWGFFPQHSQAMLHVALMQLAHVSEESISRSLSRTLFILCGCSSYSKSSVMPRAPRPKAGRSQDYKSLKYLTYSLRGIGIVICHRGKMKAFVHINTAHWAELRK